ncbi:YdeI/OmpD-associated family protein [Pedobacter sp. ASV12]|uniref:YdeI/OmpD-associated family protein n=1 Tax=Pedobacter sp. ASV12 TaxID=2795120 RepID=UPI0018EB3E82|nr:YdeI/OmpD-associated family protein [Pedobacter sp. ASV12]
MAATDRLSGDLSSKAKNIFISRHFFGTSFSLRLNLFHMQHEIINQKYLLNKMPGKGGWTFIVISEIPKEKRGYFGMVKISGWIDSYQLDNVNLMPMKNGNLFLPVKAEIRKHIGKEAGAWVDLVLYSNTVARAEHSLSTEEEFLLCLADEPLALKTYQKCSKEEQQALISWIDGAKNEDAKVERMVQAIDRLAMNQKMDKRD